MSDLEQTAGTPGPKKINVHHLTRVEGHGNIVAEIGTDGQVEACRWEVPEAPRFFEAMLLGKHFSDVHQITSRICGICSIGHQLASLQATEDAMGIRPSIQTVALRKLALHAENLQSHLLHVAYLVLPDLFGVGSVIPLASTHKNELKTLISLHRMANEFSRVVCGRTTHPQRLVPGGFAKLPTVKDLETLRRDLKDSLSGLQTAVDVLASVAGAIPAFTRPTEYVGLVSPAEYALLHGHISTSLDQTRPAGHYRDVTNEYMVRQSTAKWTKNKMGSLMVGALARFNLNHAYLTPRAKAAAKALGLSAPCHNPYMISVAQLVECVHSVEDSLALVDGLVARGIKAEARMDIRPRAGKGVGTVEVPRGLLIHAYEYDDQGRIVDADCVIPTNQNHGNIQKDMDALIPDLRDLTEAEIELRLSMLVRAYDPCISCSTHFIDIRGGGGRGSMVRFVHPN
ncbi:MAG: Ni/Fe hydrogenase subunit alpha [Deltaproteobacteria bacterium]|nr:Ni/Fe hydrogenase subunit alpha [Deltaproteobacteria bacterium]